MGASVQYSGRSLPYFVAGFALMFLMVALDMLSNRADVFERFTDPASAETIRIYVSAGEDAVKLIAESVFLSAMYSVWSMLPGNNRCNEA